MKRCWRLGIVLVFLCILMFYQITDEMNYHYTEVRKTLRTAHYSAYTKFKGKGGADAVCS